jgi:hypothetical protein
MPRQEDIHHEGEGREGRERSSRYSYRVNTQCGPEVFHGRKGRSPEWSRHRLIPGLHFSPGPDDGFFCSREVDRVLCHLPLHFAVKGAHAGFQIAAAMAHQEVGLDSRHVPGGCRRQDVKLKRMFVDVLHSHSLRGYRICPMPPSQGLFFLYFAADADRRGKKSVVFPPLVLFFELPHGPQERLPGEIFHTGTVAGPVFFVRQRRYSHPQPGKQ